MKRFCIAFPLLVALILTTVGASAQTASAPNELSRRVIVLWDVSQEMVMVQDTQFLVSLEDIRRLEDTVSAILFTGVTEASAAAFNPSRLCDFPLEPLVTPTTQLSAYKFDAERSKLRNNSLNEIGSSEEVRQQLKEFLPTKGQNLWEIAKHYNTGTKRGTESIFSPAILDSWEDEEAGADRFDEIFLVTITDYEISITPDQDFTDDENNKVLEIEERLNLVCNFNFRCTPQNPKHRKTINVIIRRAGPPQNLPRPPAQRRVSVTSANDELLLTQNGRSSFWTTNTFDVKSDFDGVTDTEPPSLRIEIRDAASNYIGSADAKYVRLQNPARATAEFEIGSAEPSMAYFSIPNDPDTVLTVNQMPIRKDARTYPVGVHVEDGIVDFEPQGSTVVSEEIMLQSPGGEAHAVPELEFTIKTSAGDFHSSAEPSQATLPVKIRLHVEGVEEGAELSSIHFKARPTTTGTPSLAPSELKARVAWPSGFRLDVKPEQPRLLIPTNTLETYPLRVNVTGPNGKNAPLTLPMLMLELLSEDNALVASAELSVEPTDDPFVFAATATFDALPEDEVQFARARLNSPADDFEIANDDVFPAQFVPPSQILPLLIGLLAVAGLAAFAATMIGRRRPPAELDAQVTIKQPHSDIVNPISVTLRAGDEIRVGPGMQRATWFDGVECEPFALTYTRRPWRGYVSGVVGTNNGNLGLGGPGDGQAVDDTRMIERVEIHPGEAANVEVTAKDLHGGDPWVFNVKLSGTAEIAADSASPKRSSSGVGPLG